MEEAGSIQAVQGGPRSGEADASPLIDSTDERFTRGFTLGRYRPQFFTTLKPEPDATLQNHPTRSVDLLDHPHTWVNAVLYPDGEGEISFCHVGIPGSRPRRKATPEEIAAKAAIRAKRKMRQLVRANGLDKLGTLTKRGGWESYAAARDFYEQWKAEIRKTLGDFDALAVPELHTGKDGHRGANFGKWHIHFAYRGFYDVRVLRAAVWKLLGDAQGNVDLQAPRYGSSAVDGVGGYLAKYIGKSFTELNRPRGQHRYWITDKLTEKLKECTQKMVFYKGTVADHMKAMEAWLIIATGKKIAHRYISADYDQGIFRTWGGYNERTSTQARTSSRSDSG